MKGKNTCGWLVLSSTGLCGRSCIGDYCKIHLALQRKGSYMKPCSVCGKGVTNTISLCVSCGYIKEMSKLIHRQQRAIAVEFKRLARITISNKTNVNIRYTSAAIWP